MPKEIDYGRRRLVFRSLPFIAAATILPSLLIPEEAQAADFEYEPYELPSTDQLRGLLSSQRYPEDFTFCYEIPPNTDTNGNCLVGNFTFTTGSDSTELQIYLSHPKEHRLITLREKLVDGCVYYNENEINYLKPGEGFNHSFSSKSHDRVATPMSIARELVLGNIPDTSFLFQGRRGESQRYSLETKTKNIEKLPAVKDGPSKEEIAKMGLIGLEGKIKGDSTKIPSGIVIYKKVDGIKIPVEIDLQYSVKFLKHGIAGLNYDNHTLKGVLQV